MRSLLKADPKIYELWIHQNVGNLIVSPVCILQIDDVLNVEDHWGVSLEEYSAPINGIIAFDVSHATLVKVKSFVYDSNQLIKIRDGPDFFSFKICDKLDIPTTADADNVENACPELIFAE